VGDKGFSGGGLGVGSCPNVHKASTPKRIEHCKKVDVLIRWKTA
jgi:hypothetical protein